MLRPLGTKAYLALALGLLFVVLSVVVVVLVNMTIRRLALTDAEHAARMLLDHNLAIHTYFSQDLKPKLFEKLDPIMSTDYFEPVWMSSTYAIRKMDGYFHHFNQSPYYYKECAINARSPENEADDYEKAFLVDLQNSPQLTTKSAIRVLDGMPYFTLLRRGEAMEESCLRCHSSPEQAPGDLVRYYGPERSFHRKVQDVVQAISIRIPLSEPFLTAKSFSFYLSGLLLAALGGGFLFVWIGNKRLLIGPMAEIQQHAVQIASEKERLGETIPEPKVRELRDLVAAFNRMSVELRRSYDKQEQRILERTKELAATNRKLEKEMEERLNVEKALRDSEELYRSLFENMLNGLAYCQMHFDDQDNPVDFTYLNVNGAFERLTGLRDVVGKRVSEVIPRIREADRELIEIYGRVAKSGRPERFEMFVKALRMWFWISVYSPQRGYFVAVFDVITDRKRAEEALRTTLQRFDTILSSLYAGVLTITEEGRVEFVNQAFCDLFDLDDPPDSLHELTAPEMIAKIQDVYANPVEVVARISEIVANNLPVKGEQVAVRGGRTYLVDYVPISVDGKSSGRLWHHNDITALKMAEEERENLRNQLLQAQKMEAIGTLTGGIAHDFNNLLTIINGFTELILMEKTEDDPSYEDLHKILETGRKGAEMVQRLLSFTKQAATRLRSLNLNPRIEESKKLMDRSFPKTIEIETILSNDLRMINADAGQMDQLLMNLFVNAKDAMPDGGRLRIETRNITVDDDYCRVNVEAKPGRHVLIEVSDTGIGMNKETIDRMFDPFFTTKGWDFRKGTGLGLSVAKGIVEQHLGWITCRSEPGKGTTFTVYFPAIEELTAVDNPEPSAERLPGGDKVLLVDDEEYVRDLGKRILERGGYEVISASNGTEALEIYAKEQSKIGLVVLDLVMPQMSGEKCLEELVKMNPQVKVVVSTGHSLAQGKRNRLSALAKGFVNKPYQIREFLEVVGAVTVK